MEKNAAIPDSKTPRANKFTLLGIFNLMDILIFIIFIALPAILIFIFCPLTWWQNLIIVLSLILLYVLFVWPIFENKGKLRDFISDFMHYAVSGKKKYNKNAANNGLNPFKSIEKENHVSYHTKEKKTGISTIKYLSFYHLNPTDTSLCNETELNTRLEAYRNFFANTKDNNFSIIKVEWPYNFNNRISQIDNELESNNHLSTIQRIAMMDNINTFDALSQGYSTNQTHYFLVINGNCIAENERTFNYLKSDLDTAGLFPIKATRQETFNIINSYFGNQLDNELNLNASVKFGPRHYQIGNKYYRTLSIAKLPNMVDAFWLSELWNFNNSIQTISFNPINDKKQQKYISQLNMAIEAARPKKLTDQYTNLKEMQSLHSLTQQIAFNDEILKSIKYTFTISANSLPELKKQYRELKKAMNRSNCKIMELSYYQWEGLTGSLPTNNLFLEKLCSLVVGNTALALSYPFTVNEYINPNGDFYGYTNSGTPLIIDWTYTDYFINSWSTLLLGMTGSGKSTTAKKIIKEHALNKKFRKIFIVDPLNEFGYITKNFGGHRIELSGLEKSGSRINPFEVLITSSDDVSGKKSNYQSFNEHLRSLEKLFQIIFQNELNEAQKGKLNRLILETYHNKKINSSTDFSKLSSKNYPIFDDFKKTIEKHYKARNRSYDDKETLAYFLETIEQYCSDGTYEALWNGPTNINLNNRIICFDIQKISSASVPKKLATAQMYLLLRFLDTQCVANQQYNIEHNLSVNDAYHIAIFIDEFHLLCDRDNLEPIRFFYHLIKQIRHYQGKLVPITQNIGDLTADPEILKETSAIVNAVKFMFIHHLNANDIENLDKLLHSVGGLTDSEKSFLEREGHGEAIFTCGNKRRMQVKIELDNLEFQLIESDMSFINNEQISSQIVDDIIKTSSKTKNITLKKEK